MKTGVVENVVRRDCQTVMVFEQLEGTLKGGTPEMNQGIIEKRVYYVSRSCDWLNNFL